MKSSNKVNAPATLGDCYRPLVVLFSRRSFDTLLYHLLFISGNIPISTFFDELIRSIDLHSQWESDCAHSSSKLIKGLVQLPTPTLSRGFL